MTKCKTVRRKIDASELAQDLSLDATEHLHGCSECRTFVAERRALHDLLTSLETVGAPSDFDFRLRARLARDKSNTRRGGVGAISRPIMAVAMVLLIAGGGFVLKNWLTARKDPGTNGSAMPPPVKADAGERVATPLVSSPLSGDQVAKDVEMANAGPNGKGSREVKPSKPRSYPNKPMRNGSIVAHNRRATAIRDSSFSAAPVVISGTGTAGAPVLVRLDPRALKISVDDGRGTSRMISWPAVSFGSQGLLAGESFQPTGRSLKGVW